MVASPSRVEAAQAAETYGNYINGEWKPAPTGSLVFFASMVPHTVRNRGAVPATYHVVNWAAPGTKAASAGAK